ncbi:hypothetical protein [Amaricoccus solimangrovi]|uniref:Uncharacterized protein n=1 Tax=Amaricoccus solimangrovi TaxID=2589815 RepID=A0A501WW86_9RHOB|nr:hypothetical protein [Amaricoccus solimangrovi]TPE51657.1 hypothetical protein FJM51_08125 [Amaricoccus solimangrovi]
MVSQLLAYFPERAAAGAAERVLRERLGGCDARVGADGDEYVLILDEPDDGRRATAVTLLREAGGRVERSVGADAPRPVQPGFAPAAPGMVPEAKPPTARDVDQTPEGGRFARQIETAPEER